MMKYFLICLLLISGMAAHGQEQRRRWHPSHPSKHRFHERTYHKRIGLPNIATVNLSLGGIGGEMGGFAGFEYERYFDKRGRFSFSIPVTGYGTRCFCTWDAGETITTNTGLYLSPGVAYHPFGNALPADFSIGAAFAFGSFHARYTHVDGVFNRHTDEDKTLTAFLLKLNLNFYPGGHGVIGMFFNIGPMRPAVGTPLLGQFGIKFGGRF